jgi:hypothetical protein
VRLVLKLVLAFIAARVRHPFGQFGQGHDASTWDGATGCGPTCVQSILYAFKRVMPTHDAIARVMGYWRPPRRTGTSAEMNAKALNHWRLSYRAAYDLSYIQLRALMGKGPVMIVVRYTHWPNWQHYNDRVRGTPWAKPYGHAGANQFPKPNILHWIVVAGVMASGPYRGLVATFEPNHDSPARPENVAIDYVSPAALEHAYRAAGKRIAIVPNHAVA